MLWCQTRREGWHRGRNIHELGPEVRPSLAPWAECSGFGVGGGARGGPFCGKFTIWGRSTFGEDLQCPCEAYSRRRLTPRRKCSIKVLRHSGGTFLSYVGAQKWKILAWSGEGYCRRRLRTSRRCCRFGAPTPNVENSIQSARPTATPGTRS